MKITLYAKLKMYVLVLAYLKLNLSIWTTNVAFTAAVEILDEGIKRINVLDQVEKTPLSVSSGKKQKKKKMLDDVMVICKAGKAYAGSIKDNALKIKFNFSRSALGKDNEGLVYARCTKIIAATVGIENKLVLFNMPIGQPAIATVSTEAYNLTITDPKDVISSHKTANKLMKDKFHELDAVLKDQLDGLVYNYQTAEPEFYAMYGDKRFIGGWSRKKVVPPVAGATTKVKIAKVKTTPVNGIPLVEETVVEAETPITETPLVVEPIVVVETPVVEAKVVVEPTDKAVEPNPPMA